MEDDALNELGDMIATNRPDEVDGWHVAHGELTVRATVGGLHGLVQHLSENAACGFTTLIDITAVDWPGREQRFDVVYHFLSMRQNHRVRVTVACGEEDVMPSITDLHPSANWFER